jgi:5-methylcytosine-specific restriction endonuclease McrA
MGVFEYLKEQELDNLSPQARRTWGMRECEECNKPFRKNANTQRFCSKKCRDKNNPHNSSLLVLRFKILSRDSFECKYCGKNPIEDKIKLQVDHITPKSSGGLLEYDNLITSCNLCNISKSDKILDRRLEEKIKGRIKRNTEKRDNL